MHPRLPPFAPEESLVRISVNGDVVARFLCSPHDLRDLALGWMFTQGIIRSRADVQRMRSCRQSGDIRVELCGQVGETIRTFTPVVSSGCGGGLVGTEQYVSPLSRLESNFEVGHQRLREIVRDMYESFHALPEHRGVHCAAIAGIHRLDEILMMTDIGRHNAVDKVIGRGLREECDFSTMILATSGRISSDMLLKAYRAGIPVVISQHAVTALAVRMAEKANMAVVARFDRADSVTHGADTRILESLQAS